MVEEDREELHTLRRSSYAYMDGYIYFYELVGQPGPVSCLVTSRKIQLDSKPLSCDTIKYMLCFSILLSNNVW